MKADGTRIENTQELLRVPEWHQYFSKLLNNKSDNADIDLKYGGEPMAEVLHQVCDTVFVRRIPPS